MKKSLLGLLLAVALIVPVFASQDKNFEIVPKIGYLFSPDITADFEGNKYSKTNDSVFSFGADFFYNLQNNFFVGLGITDSIKGQISNINDLDVKVSFLNIYATLKYKFLVNSTEEDPLFVYPLINLGIGLPFHDVTFPEVASEPDYNMSTGFYWAAGIGGEYKNIILELVYGCNYSSVEVKANGDKVSSNISYTAFRINVGYKFVL